MVHAHIAPQIFGIGGVLLYDDAIDAAEAGARQEPAPRKRRGLVERRHARRIVCFLRVAPLCIGPAHHGDCGLAIEAETCLLESGALSSGLIPSPKIELKKDRRPAPISAASSSREAATRTICRRGAMNAA
jgi:hypothetical protein